MLAGENEAKRQEVRVFAYDRKAFGKSVSRDLGVGGGFHPEVSDVFGNPETRLRDVRQACD